VFVRRPRSAIPFSGNRDGAIAGVDPAESPARDDPGAPRAIQHHVRRARRQPTLIRGVFDPMGLADLDAAHDRVDHPRARRRCLASQDRVERRSPDVESRVARACVAPPAAPA